MQENTEENEEFQKEKSQISQDKNKELVRYFLIILKIIKFKVTKVVFVFIYEK